MTDLDDDMLMPGDVTIDVDHSSINYKDGLALTGRPGVVRAPSLLAGIDLVGTVSESQSPEWAPGARVLVNGCGLGETHHGGLAERARVDSAWLVPVPESMTPLQAAAIGTAGYTAMLAVLELEDAGVAGDILVTGASGGVGSIAIALLAKLGHHVTASTGRAEEHDYLRSLGAAEIMDRAELSEPGKPLQSQRWAGAIDSVGGVTLASVLSQVAYGGTVAACGNAQSSEMTVSLMPFILRAVKLAGINSVSTPRQQRLRAWQRIATDLDLELLDSLTESVPLADATEVAERILAGRIRGRTVVDVRA
ncbi:MAG: oxidoreductase [Rhodoglobus sp.]|nr:oxidoreductase [Rhodoglobus sp.]